MRDEGEDYLDPELDLVDDELDLLGDGDFDLVLDFEGLPPRFCKE